MEITTTEGMGSLNGLISHHGGACDEIAAFDRAIDDWQALLAAAVDASHRDYATAYAKLGQAEAIIATLRANHPQFDSTLADTQMAGIRRIVDRRRDATYIEYAGDIVGDLVAAAQRSCMAGRSSRVAHGGERASRSRRVRAGSSRTRSSSGDPEPEPSQQLPVAGGVR